MTAHAHQQSLVADICSCSPHDSLGELVSLLLQLESAVVCEAPHTSQRCVHIVKLRLTFRCSSQVTHG